MFSTVLDAALHKNFCSGLFAIIVGHWSPGAGGSYTELISACSIIYCKHLLRGEFGVIESGAGLKAPSLPFISLMHFSYTSVGLYPFNPPHAPNSITVKLLFLVTAHLARCVAAKVKSCTTGQ